MNYLPFLYLVFLSLSPFEYFRIIMEQWMEGIVSIALNNNDSLTNINKIVVSKLYWIFVSDLWWILYIAYIWQWFYFSANDGFG
jgi:hypothetical protein